MYEFLHFIRVQVFGVTGTRVLDPGEEKVSELDLSIGRNLSSSNEVRERGRGGG